MKQKMFSNPFSFHGRIRRMEYVISYVIYCVGIVFTEVISIFMQNMLGYSFAGLLRIVLLFVFAWFITAQNTKRCHDRGQSGWWQIIPIYNPFFLAFSDGEEYPNDYGPDPKGRNLYE